MTNPAGTDVIEDDTIVLDWSDDQGRSFHGARHIRVNRTGGYVDRIRATRLGSSRNRMFRVRMSGEFRRAFLGVAYVTFTEAAS